VRTILVPHDFSEHADHALHHAQELAQLYDADILPVHVIEELTVPVVYEVEPTEVDTERVRERTTSALREATNVRDVRVVSGHAGRRLVEVAEEEDVDLVVLATHGRTGLSRMLLGSVAETVIRRAPCPVFTVKATPTSDAISPDADDADR
jgi:nucleotide-binding universal stress UspA family protein